MIKFGINGFGRIGRLALRSTIKNPSRGQVVAINNPGIPIDYLAYLLKYDSAQGTFNAEVTHNNKDLIVNGKTIKVFTESDPEKIKWSQAGVDTILECTGKFLTAQQNQAHFNEGVKKLIMSAPAKDDTPMFVYGVNHNDYNGQKIISNASCTTNCVATQVLVLEKHFGIEEALMTTVHAVTISQKAVDGQGKNYRIGRACINNIIPSSTGAAKAVTKVIPSLKGRITGMAFRVPVVDGSCVDLTVRLKTKTSLKEISQKYKEESEGGMKGIIKYSEDEIVSSDVIGQEYSSIYDSKAGIELNDQFFKLISWYDNEAGYANRLVDLAHHISTH